LGVFYENTWPAPRFELVSDFIEGIHYTKRAKVELYYVDP